MSKYINYFNFNLFQMINMEVFTFFVIILLTEKPNADA